MMQKIKIIFVLFCMLLISGCHYFVDDSKLSQQERMCRYLKRQMTYNSFSRAADARYTADSQTDALRERYEEYGCYKATH